MQRLFRMSKVDPVIQTSIFNDVTKLSYPLKKVGLFPLTFQEDKFLLSPKLLLLSLTISFSTLVLDFLSNTLVDLNNKKNIFKYIVSFQHVFLSAANLSLLYLLGNLSLLNKLLQDLNTVDEFIKRQGKGSTWRPEWKWTVAVMGLLTGGFLLRTTPDWRWEHSVKLVFIYWPSYPLALLAALSTGLVGALRARLQSLSSLAKPAHLRLLPELARCHHLACGAGHQLNCLLGLTFLTLTAHCFCQFVCELYLLSLSLSAFFSLEYILIKFIWSGIAFIIFYRICHECDQATKKAKEFNIYLYQLMLEDKTNEILSNPKLRLHIAMKRDVVFTAWGFFNLDYTLIHSMVSSATTYLVILIQFGEVTMHSSHEPPASTGSVNLTTPFTPLLITNV